MPFGLSNSPLAYRDIAEAFDRAIANGKGIRIRCASKGAAKSLQVRSYKYRTIDRQENSKVYAEQPDHPLYGRSEMDSIIISIEEKAGVWYVVYTCSTPERLDSMIEDLTDEDVQHSLETPRVREPQLDIVPRSILKRRES
jgi:hypothetical protein